MADLAQLYAAVPPGAPLDPAAIEAANAATSAFVNPVPAAAPAPFANVSPEEAARLGIAFPPVGLPAAQQAGAAFVAPPPPVAAPPPVAPPVAPAATPIAPASGTAAAVSPGGGIHAPNAAGDVQAIGQASQATQGALVQQGEAQAAADTAESEVRGAGREQMQLAQDHIRETQAQRDTAIRAINADQQAAYDEAHRATIPDFFEGRFGVKAAAAVSMALGEAGRGLLAFGTGANVGNTAKDIIDRTISGYYGRKKEEIDNLFKYAAARNQLGEQQKAAWATKLNDLQFEMAATHQAMADHILEVGAASKGRIAQSTAQVLAKQQAESAVALEQKARETNFNNQLSVKRLGIESYNAQSERMRALQDKQAQVEIRIGGAIDNDLKGLEKRIAKPREQLAGIDSLLGQMDEAYAAHDSNRLAGLVVALKEQVGPLFAGGKTTGNLTKQLDSLGTTKDEIQKTFGKLTGGNNVGDTQYKRLREMMHFGATEKAESIGNDRGAYMTKYLGPGGMANTPAAKQRFLNNLNGITSEIKLGGQPLFQEGGAPATSPTAPSVPSGWTATGQKTKDGRPVYRGPNGELGTP